MSMEAPSQIIVDHPNYPQSNNASPLEELVSSPQRGGGRRRRQEKAPLSSYDGGDNTQSPSIEKYQQLKNEGGQIESSKIRGSIDYENRIINTQDICDTVIAGSTSVSPQKQTRMLPPKDWASLKRKLFPRLVVLRVAFPEWDDHLSSGRWHTEFILSKATKDNLEDYKAILGVIPTCHLNTPSDDDKSPFASATDRRIAVCAIQGLDALRLDADIDFQPLSHQALLLTTTKKYRNASCHLSSDKLKRHSIRNEDGLDFSEGSRDDGGFCTRNNNPSPMNHIDWSPVESSEDEDAAIGQDSLLPVDGSVPHRRHFHVFKWGRTEWTVTLKKEEKRNLHHFFIMQLLEKDNGEEFVLFCRWGRDGEDGSTSCRRVENLIEGKRLFEETFEIKTGNKWQGSCLRSLPRFIPIKGKYILLDDLSDHVSLALPLRGIIGGSKSRRS